MKLVLSALLFVGCVYAEESTLIETIMGKWKLAPIVKKGETIEPAGEVSFTSSTIKMALQTGTKTMNFTRFQSFTEWNAVFFAMASADADGNTMLVVKYAPDKKHLWITKSLDGDVEYNLLKVSDDKEEAAKVREKGLKDKAGERDREAVHYVSIRNEVSKSKNKSLEEEMKRLDSKYHFTKSELEAALITDKKNNPAKYE